MSDVKYDKIKHLVEVDDDIMAVFTVTLKSPHHIENLSIAENAHITKEFVYHIFDRLQVYFENKMVDIDNRMGPLKWIINENELIRTLIIFEKDRFVIVLIKSNITLSESVDNILGYYYEPEG